MKDFESFLSSEKRYWCRTRARSVLLITSFHSLNQTHGRIQAVSFSDIPPLQVPHFVPRPAFLAFLEKLFEPPTTPSSRLVVVLYGMGGQGKTQLSLEYCRRMKDVGKFRAIFWLDASSREALYRAMEAIAKRMLPERVLDSRHAAASLVKDVLSAWSDAWLMVFDNLDNPSDLDGILDFFPDSCRGCILVTSRYVGSKGLGQSIEVDCMEKEEGLQLLLRSADADSDELAAAEQILTLLGYLPLAIDQTRAYISRRQLPLRDFIVEYQRRKQTILKETPRFWMYRHKRPDTQEETSLSLFTTWEMSLSLLRSGEGQAAALEKVLTVFGFFHHLGISEKPFSVCREEGLADSPMSIFVEDGDWVLLCIGYRRDNRRR